MAISSQLAKTWQSAHPTVSSKALAGSHMRPVVRFGDEYYDENQGWQQEGGSGEYKTDTGRLARWNGDRGFGFIRPDDGSEDLFTHVTSLVDGEESVSRGDFVTYVKEWNDRTGKYEALEVRVDSSKEREVATTDTGVVLRWNGDRGFGFIKPDSGGEDIFAHVTHVQSGEDLGIADKVAFTKDFNDRKGKYEATDIRIVEKGTGELPTEGPSAEAVPGKGQLVRWNHERGFGFIKPEDEDEDLFVHISGLADGEGSVVESNLVTFLKDFNDRKGNYQAYDVKFAGEGPPLDQGFGDGEEGAEEASEESEAVE